MKNNKPSVLFVSTYPPRLCGIATFTRDLKTAIDKKSNSKFKSKIVIMDNNDSKNFKYSDDVILRIKDNNIKNYVDAAKKINRMGSVKLVNIQHEFNIFGGYYGEYLLKFIEHLEKPIIVTFHTVQPDKLKKSKFRNRIVKEISEKSEFIVVLNKLAVNILKNDCKVPTSKIVVIPHGIHYTPYKNSAIEKKMLGYEDRLILTTFGFIRKSKKIDIIMDSLPEVVKKFPNVLYLVIGETHPVLSSGKTTYLKFLKRKAEKMGLENNVRIINKYVSLNKLLKYLGATDIYVSSGRGFHQIVSGTLAYAIGAGKPVITIPTLYAKEVVTKDRGILVELGNTESYSKAIIKLLSNPELREKMGKNAYDFSRHMLWSNVAESYMDVFKKYM